MTSSLFRLKPIGMITDGEHQGEPHLKRSISTFSLSLIGVGCTIGTGIFFIFETAVPKAGPAIVLSFVVAAIVAAFTALCYAELAARLPVAGSSYSYTYATMGEIVAFCVGILLLFEYAIAAAAVSVGWSEYLNEFLHQTVGFTFPDWMSHAPGVGKGFGINIPAVVLILLCCLLLIRGAKESARVNAIMVCIKVGVLIFFAVVAFVGFQAKNFTPFMPLGIAGVGAAAGSVFFSFIGLDVISTAGEEVKNPQKALPIALMLALGIVTVVYVLVALAAVGGLPWDQFEGKTAVLAKIVSNTMHAGWPSIIMAAAAIISIFSCTLVTIFGQTRILYSMSRDGMIPKVFSIVDAQRSVPVKNTWIVSIFCMILAAIFPLELLADLVSMGTLLAFIIVSAGVIVLRRREGKPTGFKVPLYPVFPIMSALSCVYLISQLPMITWIWCAIVLTVGFVIYFTYSRKHSVLNNQTDASIVE